MNLPVKQARSQSAPVRQGSRPLDAVDLFVFLIPCLQYLEFHVIGALDGSDILLLITFVYFAFRGKIRITAPAGKKFVLFASLWLASQIVTDIVRRTAFVDYARGWSNVGLTIVNFAALYVLLYGRPRRLVLYGWGILAACLILWIFPSENTIVSSALWKFGGGEAVNLGAFLLASSKRLRGYWPVILGVSMGIVDFLTDFRDMGGACLLAVFCYVVNRLLEKRGRLSIRLKPATAVALGLSLLIGVAGIWSSYKYAARSGWLGPQALMKYNLQSGGKYGVLLGGRTELLAELPAVYASPILGHGSWAKDPAYVLVMRAELIRLGYLKDAKDITRTMLVQGNIPAHSYLFGAWVSAGILGAFFWAWAFKWALGVYIRIYPSDFPLLPVMYFVATTTLWSILFSPYGAQVRVIFPYFFILLMTCMDMTSRGQAATATGRPKRRIITMSRSGRSAEGGPTN